MGDRRMGGRIAAGRILIIRPSALGDVCRTVPILSALRRAAPDAAIHWLVQDSFAQAIEAHPDLDGIIAFPRSRLRGLLRRPQAWGEAFEFFRSIHQARFDLVIDCQGLARSGLMSLCSGAPRRIADRAARELGWLGANQRVDVPSGVHEVDRMLALVAAAGGEADGDETLHVSDLKAPRGMQAGMSCWPRRHVGHQRHGQRGVGLCWGVSCWRPMPR